MYKTYKYKNGEIKLLKNEIPMARDYEYRSKFFQVIRKTQQLDNEFSLGIEMKIHRGGRICYGLLGAEVKSGKNLEAINVHIAYTDKNRIRYNDSCLINDEFVYKGLPEEYIEKINSSITEDILNRKNFPQCDIFFDYAANCEVGSSPALFGCIAKMLIRLISSNLMDQIFNMGIKEFTEEFVQDVNLRY